MLLSYIKIVLPGPNGRLKPNQTSRSSTHATAKDMTRGSMVAIIVPSPDFLSYFKAVIMMNGMNGSKGEIAFVTESAIRKAACVNAGEKFSFINIGTKIGAISAHLAEALPITKLISIVIPIKHIINGAPVSLLLLKNSEPCTDR